MPQLPVSRDDDCGMEKQNKYRFWASTTFRLRLLWVLRAAVLLLEWYEWNLSTVRGLEVTQVNILNQRGKTLSRIFHYRRVRASTNINVRITIKYYHDNETTRQDFHSYNGRRNNMLWAAWICRNMHHSGSVNTIEELIVFCACIGKHWTWLQLNDYLVLSRTVLQAAHDTLYNLQASITHVKKCTELDQKKCNVKWKAVLPLFRIGSVL